MLTPKFDPDWLVLIFDDRSKQLGSIAKSILFNDSHRILKSPMLDPIHVNTTQQLVNMPLTG